MAGRHAPRWWLRRAGTAVLLAAAAALTGAGVAAAHAVLESTDPASGVVLTAEPATVSLTFGESVQLPPSGLRVFDPGGVEVDDGNGSHPGGAGNIVAVGLRPTAAQGSYTVAWRVISADTHPVSGAFTFSVGHPSATAVVAAPPGGSLLVGVLYAVVRALAYAAFAALVGGAALLLGRPGGVVWVFARRVATAGWTVLLPVTVATLLLQGPYGDGTGLAAVLDPGGVAATLQLPLGIALVARLLLLALTPVYLGRLVRPPSAAGQRAALVVLGVVLGVGAAATWSVSGHAAEGFQAALALPVDVAHLLAMGVWLGGLLVLGLALRRPDDAAGPVVARFSPVALGCVTVLVGTGTYQSWRQLGSWSAFLDTAYGQLLLIKILVVVVLLGVASVSRRAVQRRARSGTATLRRAVLVEAVIGVVVIGLTAVLVNLEPGRTAEAAVAAAHQGPLRASVPYNTGGTGGTGTLDVLVTPARTGPDTVAVTVHGPTGAVVDVAELDVELGLPARSLGPLRLPVTRRSAGHYEAAGQIPLAGQWQLALTVRTSDVDETTLRVPLPVP